MQRRQQLFQIIFSWRTSTNTHPQVNVAVHASIVVIYAFVKLIRELLLYEVTNETFARRRFRESHYCKTMIGKIQM